MNIHIDKNIGIAGFKVYWMRSKDNKSYWCKRAIAIMGTTNMSIEELESISPFDPKFNDNYVEGKGKTKKEAIENLALHLTFPNTLIA